MRALAVIFGILLLLVGVPLFIMACVDLATGAESVGLMIGMMVVMGGISLLGLWMVARVGRSKSVPIEVHGFAGNLDGLEQGLAIQSALVDGGIVSETDQSAKVNAAARLLLSKKFEEAIVAYEKIAREHPDSRGECESQIGAAHFFLGNFQRAISHYESARANGADSSMMQDNIQEAQQALQNS